MGRLLLGAYDRLLQVLGGISAFGLLTIPVLVAYDVISRNVGGRSVVWVADISEYALFISTMVGAPWLLHLGRHVRISLLPGLLSGRASRVFEGVLNALMLVVCCLLIAYAFVGLGEALQYRTMLYKSLSVPVWPFIAIFLFSFTVIAVELVVRLLTGRTGSEDGQLSH